MRCKTDFSSDDPRKFECGIYRIVSPSGKFYIGSAVNFEIRFKRHINALIKGDNHSYILQNACNKYGLENLKFEKLLVCKKTDLIMFEQLLIDGLKPAYNILKIADSPLGIKRRPERKHIRSAGQLGRVHPPESRLKMSESAKGRKNSEEHKQKISEGLGRHYLSPEARQAQSERSRKCGANPITRKKISEALTGIKRSDETKARMSKAQLGHPSTLKGIPRSEEVKRKISETKLKRFQEKRDAQK